MKAALSIAGSDSGAGAGIQADIKTFSALGVYGCTALTAITAQDTRSVAAIFPLPHALVRDQISSVLRDFSPSAIKIGMVYNSEIIDAVANSLRRTKATIILDPILAAGTGARLLREDALEPLKSRLLPISTLVTPNRMEAEELSGCKIRTENDAILAAKRIQRLGARNVVVKGGHFGRRTVTDILVDSRMRVSKMSNPRIDMGESHGSGCNFSAAATAYLAKGIKVDQACRMANEYVHYAIAGSVKVGKGLPVTNPLASIYRDAMKYRVIEDLQKSVEEVSVLPNFHLLIPETQTNFVYAIPGASEISQVAAVRGRIVRIGNSSVPASYIEFGASKHMASAVLAYMSVRPAVRSAANIRYDKKLVEICTALFDVSSYDRRTEPPTAKRKEGSTMSWGVLEALSAKPDADVIYHRGDVGKEPMINIFGVNPAEVAGKIKRILKSYQRASIVSP